MWGVGVGGGGTWPNPGQLRGLSWRGGLHLSAPRGPRSVVPSVSLPLSSPPPPPLSLSPSVQLDMQGSFEPPTPPPSPPFSSSSSRSRPVLPSHAWPSLGIHSGCFLLIASSPLLSHQRPPPPSFHTPPHSTAQTPHPRVLTLCLIMRVLTPKLPYMP